MTHRILTGVTTTGIPHLGNYVGAIRPAIRAAAQDNAQSYLFLANYHGIIKCHDPAMIAESTRAVAATWLACGLNTERTTFYRQSDIPEILELNWILTCITAKGLMNRAHAYKAAVQNNVLALQNKLKDVFEEANASYLNLKNIFSTSENTTTEKKPNDYDKKIIDDNVKKLYDSLSYLEQDKFYDLFSWDEHSLLGAITTTMLFDSEWITSKKGERRKEIFSYIEKILTSLHILTKETRIPSLIDPDYEIEMGLYSYPILMTADILMFKANSVPVGRDQIQHVEMARDIAQRFNHRFGKEIFVLPEAAIDENVQLLVGLDGRKMSKSYGNTIPLFQTPKQRQKSVNKIVTNLKEPGESKQKDESPLFEIYQAFSTPEETREFEKMLNEGLAWGEAKKLLAAKIGAELDDKTDVYNDLIAHPSRIEDILQAGAAKARAEAKELLAEAKDAVGIRTLK